MTQHAVYLLDTFLTQIREAMPSTLSFDGFLAACQHPLCHSIHANTLETSVTNFLQLTAPYDWTLTPIPWCEEGFWIERDSEGALPLGNIVEYLSDLFYIQEVSSALPVAALFADGNVPQRVVDAAVVPDSKTMQIAAWVNNKGAIPTNELSASRVKVLYTDISRCGISNVTLTHFDSRVFGATVPEIFDTILLDVPHSGEGTVCEDSGTLRNWSPENNQEIAAIQQELIDSAFHALRLGDTLVYSTCILNREENETICLWLKETYHDAVEFLPLGDLFPDVNRALTEDGFLHVFSQIYDCEGFFVVRLCKTQTIPVLSVLKYKVGNFLFSPMKDHGAGQIRQAAASVGLNWDENLRLWQRGKELWLLPAGVEVLVSKVRFSRLGIKLAGTHNKGYCWQREAVIILASPDNVNAFELTPQEVEERYRGRDVYP